MLIYVVSKTQKYDLYWINSTSKTYWFSTPVLQKNRKFRNQNIRFRSVVPKVLCEFELVPLPNSIELNPWIEFDLVRLNYRFDWVRLTMPGTLWGHCEDKKTFNKLLWAHIARMRKSFSYGNACHVGFSTGNAIQLLLLFNWFYYFSFRLTQI